MMSDELVSPRGIVIHPSVGSSYLTASQSQPVTTSGQASINLSSSQTSAYFTQDSHHDTNNFSLLHPQFSILEELNRTQRLHQLWQSNLASYGSEFASPIAWKGRSQVKTSDAHLEDDTMFSPNELSAVPTSHVPLLPLIHSHNNNHHHSSSTPLSSQPVSAGSSPYHFLLSPPPSAHFLSSPPPPGVLLSSAILSSDSFSAQSSNNGNNLNSSQSLLSASYQSLTPLCSKPSSRQPSCDYSTMMSPSNILQIQSPSHHSHVPSESYEFEAVQQLEHIQSQSSRDSSKAASDSGVSPLAVTFEVELIPLLPAITLQAKNVRGRSYKKGKSMKKEVNTILSPDHDQRMSTSEAELQLPHQSVQNLQMNNDQKAILTEQVMRAAALANAAVTDGIDSLELPQLSSVTSSLHTTPTTSALHSRSSSPFPNGTDSAVHSANSSSVTSPQEPLIANRAASSSNDTGSPTNTLRNRSNYTKVCPYAGCNARFPKESTLRRHIRCHTGEKPFKCVVDGCDAAFSEKGNLLRHEASAHRNERKFTCPFPYCLTEFRRAAHVEQHVQTQHVSKGEDVSRAYSYLKPPEKSRKRAKCVVPPPVSLSVATVNVAQTSKMDAKDDDFEINSMELIPTEFSSQPFTAASAPHTIDSNVSIESTSFNVIRGRHIAKTNRAAIRTYHPTRMSLHPSSSSTTSNATTPSSNNLSTNLKLERRAATLPSSPISPAKKKQRGSKSI